MCDKLLIFNLLKRTKYIELLTSPNVTKQQLDNVFNMFINEVYHFCVDSTDNNLIYFTLQYTRAKLLQIQKKGKVEMSNAFYLEEAILFIETSIKWHISYGNTIKARNKSSIVWTGKIIHLMEFIYGADTLKDFNNGHVTIKEVSEYFGEMLGIEIKDPSGCYVSMRERIKESRTSYIDSMREALLERMEKDDEKTYRRKK